MYFFPTIIVNISRQKNRILKKNKQTNKIQIIGKHRRLDKIKSASEQQLYK